MMIAGFRLLLVSSFLCAGNQVAAEVMPGESGKAGCTAVYILSTQGGMGAYNDAVKVVQVAVDAQPEQVRGKLFRRDWGAFEACGAEVALRFRTILQGTRGAGPIINEPRQTYRVKPGGRKRVFFELGFFTWKEVSEERGQRTKKEIEESIGPPALTGWEWKDRRELYYSPRCRKEISEDCP